MKPASATNQANRRRPLMTRWLVLLPPICLLAWLSHHYYPFFADDGFISLRYAQRLLDGRGLTWTDGERVEGYSNLLYVLLVAGLGGLGVDLIWAARLVGLTGAIGVLFALDHLRSHAPDTSPWPWMIGMLAVAGCSPLAVWAIGGLEQTLYASLLLWGLALALPLLNERPHLSAREIVYRSLPFAGLCLTRPDGPIFVATFAAVILVLRRFRRDAWRDCCLHVGVPTVAVLGQLSFRLAYYGDWVPNPAHIKAAVSARTLELGLDYVFGIAPSLAPILPLVGLGAVASLTGYRGRTAIALTACAVAWLTYIACVGGDIFPAHRHHVPLLGIWGVVVAHGLAWASEGVPLRGRFALTTLSATLCAGLVQAQLRDPKNAAASSERWEWHGEAVGNLFRESFAPRRPLLAVTAAGSVPYFSRLPALDMLGLNDRHIARQPGDPKRALAHNHGDGTYVLDRAPDLVLFGPPRGRGPINLAGQQMGKDPRFAAGYLGVPFEALDPYFVANHTFVRSRGRVGMSVTNTGADIPAYLLSGATGLAGPRTTMAARLQAGQDHASPTFDLPAGAWQFALAPVNPRVEVSIHVDDGQVGFDGSTVLVEEATRIRLSVRAGKIDTVVGRLVLERAEAGPRDAVVHGTRHVLQSGRFDQGREANVQVLGDFNDGLGGWVASGHMAVTHKPVGPQQQAVRHQVRGFVNSFHPTRRDATRGRLISPPFRVDDGTWLRLQVGGATIGAGAYVVDEAGRRLLGFAGQRDERLRVRAVDLSPYADRTLRIEIADDSVEPWGHILVDEVALCSPRTSQPTSRPPAGAKAAARSRLSRGGDR
ncbi:MAG: hypothetical protein B7733_20080 [Myxococcales bacterium FL481]|nr:MAG: hypothetical protein B7733_20080 [Myxococcales bacterium FL481]